MGNNIYIPQPFDTSDVKLPEELIDLGEQIAKNVHDVWSLGRINEGWTYGPERNDAEKKHLCLRSLRGTTRIRKRLRPQHSAGNPATDYEVEV